MRDCAPPQSASLTTASPPSAHKHSISSILIAVNPYEELDCYGKDSMELYASKTPPYKPDPHIFNVAEDCYRTLDQFKRNQALIVCGESGAGKSESAKLLMRHLAYTTARGASQRAEVPKADAKRPRLSRSGSARKLSIGKQSSRVVSDSHKSSFRDLGSIVEEMSEAGAPSTVESKILSILACNPILEAFGNAKTLLNNNSSRFGKFTKLLFSGAGEAGTSSHINGSSIETFLLEASRVVIQNKDERNYHCFYQIFAGLEAKTRKSWALTSPDNFRYLNQSGCVELPGGESDAEKYVELQNAMKMAGFSDESFKDVQRVLAAILHIGNLSFRNDKKEKCLVKKEAKASLKKVAGLLGVDEDKLTELFTVRHLTVGTSEYAKPYLVKDARVNRDSAAKSLYSGLFNWIVNKINASMCDEEQDQDRELFIGILDVFGFECFEKNSFEQMCINLANERLQTFFNERIVASEQAEYLKEAVFWTPVEMPDNSRCLSGLMDRKTGLFSLLDSTCRTPNADVLGFTQALFSAAGVGTDHPFIKPANETQAPAKKKKKKKVVAKKKKPGHKKSKSNLFTSSKKKLPTLRKKKSTMSMGGIKGAKLKAALGKKKAVIQKKKAAAAPRTLINGILVNHYAKPVVYDADEFLAKNVEKVSADLAKTLAESKKGITSELVSAAQGKKRKKKGGSKKGGSKKGDGKAKRKATMMQKTVSGTFIQQLKTLMVQLEQTEPFFIRCVKPNLEKSPATWNPELVTSQLESGGLVQALKIVKLGYPTRVEYQALHARYASTLDPPPAGLNARDFAEALLRAKGVRPSQIELGLTKAFFRENMQDMVQELLNPAPGPMAPELARAVRGHLTRKKLVRTLAVVRAYSRMRTMLSGRRSRAIRTVQATALAKLARGALQRAVGAARAELASNLASLRSEADPALTLLGTQIRGWLQTIGVPCSPAGGVDCLYALSNGVVLTRVVASSGDGAGVALPRVPAPPGSARARANARDFAEAAGGAALGVSGDSIALLRDPRSLCNLLARVSLLPGLEPLPIISFLSSEEGVDPGQIVLFAADQESGALDGAGKDLLAELKEPGATARRRAEAEAERARAEAEAERRAREAAAAAAAAKAKRIAEAKVTKSRAPKRAPPRPDQAGIRAAKAARSPPTRKQPVVEEPERKLKEEQASPSPPAQPAKPVETATKAAAPLPPQQKPSVAGDAGTQPEKKQTADVKQKKAPPPPLPRWDSELNVGGEGRKRKKKKDKKRRKLRKTKSRMSGLVHGFNTNPALAKDAPVGRPSAEVLATRIQARFELLELKSSLQNPEGNVMRIVVTEVGDDGTSWSVYRSFFEVEAAYRAIEVELDSNASTFHPLFPYKLMTIAQRVERLNDFFDFLLGDQFLKASLSFQWTIHSLLSTKCRGRHVAAESFVQYGGMGNSARQYAMLENSGRYPRLSIAATSGAIPHASFDIKGGMNVERKGSEIEIPQLGHMESLVFVDKDGASVWSSTIKKLIRADATNNPPVALDEAKLFIGDLIRVLNQCKEQRWFQASGFDWKSRLQPMDAYKQAMEEGVSKEKWSEWGRRLIERQVTQYVIMSLFDKAVRGLVSDPEKQIYLEYEGVTDESVERMCLILGELKSEIYQLRLGSNQITARGCAALARMLADPNGCKVRELFLSGNCIGDSGARALAQALRSNTCLEMLVIYSCSISDEGARCLLGAIKSSNRTIRCLDIYDNYISEDIAVAIKSACRDNVSKLTMLDEKLNVLDHIPELNTPQNIYLLEFFFERYLGRVLETPGSEKFKKLDQAKFLKYLYEKEPGPLTKYVSSVLTFCGWVFEPRKKRWRLQTVPGVYEPLLRQTLRAISFRAKRMPRREEARIFYLCRHALRKCGAFLRGMVEKREIFKFVRQERALCQFLGVNPVQSGQSFATLFEFLAMSSPPELPVGRFVEFVGAVKHLMMKLLQIFRPSAAMAQIIKPQKAFMAVKREDETREHFNAKKMPPFKQFVQFFEHVDRKLMRQGSAVIDSYVTSQLTGEAKRS